MNSRKENRKWHWVFWIVYFLVNHFIFAEALLSPTSVCINIAYTLHNAGTAYVIIDWWIPRLYQEKRYGLFILASLGTVCFFTLLLGMSLLGIAQHFIHSSISLGNMSEYFPNFQYSIFWSNLSAITLFLIPSFILQRIEMERRNNQLEKEKLATELQLLKSQLHPHFLFNALNNIYFLIKKDPETAAEALAGFSSLLRFQLYEANNATVSLAQEIDYLQQFVEIAQLRKGENFKVNWILPKDTTDIQIAPLLLMTLVENAFKHGPNKNGQIDINLTIEKNTLQFYIANNKEVDNSQGIAGFEEGGIGLANIQKRLQLLYAERHQYSIEETDGIFTVKLMLDLN